MTADCRHNGDMRWGGGREKDFQLEENLLRVSAHGLWTYFQEEGGIILSGTVYLERHSFKCLTSITESSGSVQRIVIRVSNHRAMSFLETES